ncbi:unnamed protein product, partial [Ectocarpus sp. 12 AP-2014]
LLLVHAQEEKSKTLGEEPKRREGNLRKGWIKLVLSCPFWSTAPAAAYAVRTTTAAPAGSRAFCRLKFFAATAIAKSSSHSSGVFTETLCMRRRTYYSSIQQSRLCTRCTTYI